MEKNAKLSLLELMVSARSSELLMWIESNLGGGGSIEINLHRVAAWEAAELAGYLNPSVALPTMLHEKTELADAWHYGQARHEAEVREAENEIFEQQKAEKVEAVLRGESDWNAIGTPSPEEAIKTLLVGQQLCVNGHHVWHEGGVTWFTNSYGQDGVLAAALDIEMMTSFLSDMARGKEYGPVPH